MAWNKTDGSDCRAKAVSFFYLFNASVTFVPKIELYRIYVASLHSPHVLPSSFQFSEFQNFWIAIFYLRPHIQYWKNFIQIKPAKSYRNWTVIIAFFVKTASEGKHVFVSSALRAGSRSKKPQPSPPHFGSWYVQVVWCFFNLRTEFPAGRRKLQFDLFNLECLARDIKFFTL